VEFGGVIGVSRVLRSLVMRPTACPLLKMSLSVVIGSATVFAIMDAVSFAVGSYGAMMILDEVTYLTAVRSLP